MNKVGFPLQCLLFMFCISIRIMYNKTLTFDIIENSTLTEFDYVGTINTVDIITYYDLLKC